MRQAFVLFLFFAVILTSSAQSNRANIWLEQGRSLVQKKEYKDAFKKYKRAASTFRKEKKKRKQINTLLELANIYIVANENFEADKLAYDIIGSISKRDTLAASAYQVLSLTALSDSKYQEALSHIKRTLKIQRIKLSDNHPAIAESLKIFSIIQNNLGQNDLASENILLALEINQSVFGENHPTTAETLGVMGNIYSTRGEYRKGIEYLQEAIDILKNNKSDKEKLIAQFYFHLGNAHISMGNYDLGLSNTQYGLTIIENLEETENPDRAPFLNNIGKIFTLRGDFTKARQNYTDALDLIEFHRGPEHAEVIPSFYNLGEMYQAQGIVDSALIYFQKSLKLNQKIYGENHPQNAKILSEIGTTYFNDDKYDGALTYYNNAFTKYDEFYGTHHMGVAFVEQQTGKTFLKKGELEIALSHFQSALNSNVPFSFEAKDISKNPDLKNVLNKNIFLSSLTLKAQTLTKLYLSKEVFGNLELAFESFLLCDSLIDDIRKSFIEFSDQLIFNQTVAQVYEEAIYTCLILYNKTQDKKYIAQAFYFSEKSKSNTLLQSFTNNEALRFANIPDSLEAQEVLLKINISFAQKQLSKVIQTKDSLNFDLAQEELLESKDAYNEFINDLENNFPNYYQLKYNTSVATLEEVQQSLKKGTALIEYMSGNSRLFTFTITSDDAYINFINKPSDYNDLIFSFRKSLTDRDYISHGDSIEHAYQTFSSSAFELYNILLKDPLNLLSKNRNKKLIIVPDGLLGYIPFEILIKEKPESTSVDYKNLDYLLNHHSISYAFSGSLLLKHQNSEVITKHLRYGGFASDYSSGKLSLNSNSKNLQYFKSGKYIDLPASRENVQKIAKLLDGEYFIGDSATEAIFKDTSFSFDILHLAMHGVYDDKNPLNSHLVFTQTEDDNEDNYLTSSELYNMKMNARLVYLGACNSGFGKINRGEGIMSLSRSFAYAGCPSIVMSLWSVPDNETAIITHSFFKELKNGKSKDDALQFAKLQYLNTPNIAPNRQHPLYWAGFVPIGDMSPLYDSNFFSYKWVVAIIIGMILLAFFARRWKKRKTI